MITLEQVDRDIELARYDMHELMKMRQPISIVSEELLELYDERADILKAIEGFIMKYSGGTADEQ